jgi:hypothetical protein
MTPQSVYSGGWLAGNATQPQAVYSWGWLGFPEIAVNLPTRPLPGWHPKPSGHGHAPMAHDTDEEAMMLVMAIWRMLNG